MLKIAILALSSGLAFGEVLFSQQPLFELNGLKSSTGGQQLADLFEVRQPSEVTSVRWSGFFIPTAADPQSIQFRISFHEGSQFSISRSPIAEATVKPAVTTRLVSAFDDPQFPLHSLEAVLPRPVFVEGSKPYWISIVDVTSGAFQWQEGEDLMNNWASRGGAGQDDSWRVFESVVGRTGVAFTLEGVSVPEPRSTALLAVAGGFWLLFSGRRIPTNCKARGSGHRSNICSLG